MSTDFKLNLGAGYMRKLGNDVIYIDHGDLDIDANGNIKIIPEDDIVTQVAQKIHIRCYLKRGELFFNLDAGFPYIQISKYKNSKSIFDNYMEEYLLETEGVASMTSYSSTLDNFTRQISVQFSATTLSGETAEGEVNI
ncbi:baseplate wedge subunit [Erwinia phage phiEa104]|uniref:Uncharacterized protein n=6 Tax=Kolesnikvirus TaxID=1985293 RepID=A0A6B9RGN2_9CAUD|nr:baseplate wedge subunit [Erwinia phage phiEa21-4]YP_004327041.1 baseplate wedge subunit [Erwinia phage phiEa104]AXN57387.1 hypothetical protein SUNLIREN_87 [Erwinia phage SunLIRen]AYD79576.1 hypothetical protein LINGLNFE_00068 [Enterobacter phage phi63_307]QEG07716.1 hypothetical protein [Salmonella phage SE5]QHI00610.1 hypothetical protein [Salmonella phage vB_SenM_SB18]UFD98408.1 hypothetical protein SPARTY_85 [Hafnia phage vB_HalM_SPARTY]WJN64969.1 putative baseplate wedge subunit [Erw